MSGGLAVAGGLWLLVICCWLLVVGCWLLVWRRGTLRGMEKLSAILPDRLDPEQKQKYISQEFQDYGYRLAVEMGEEGRKAMYIKLAKTKPRQLLEQARSYVTDYPNAKNKGKLFLWKIKDLESGSK